MTTTYPASERQQAFIRTLIEERVCDREAVLADLPFYSSKDASAVIGRLLDAPRKESAKPKGNPLLADIPKAKYAIPTAELAVVSDLVGLEAVKNDLLFLEVKEYKGTVYMRRLLGAPGAFTRVRLSHEAVAALASILKADPYKYTRLFGEHYACCGKCGAELTDEESRRLMLGPVCRQAFGF